MENWLETLKALLGWVLVLAFFGAALFMYGSSIGEWFSQLAAENRKVFWAAVALACWTGVVAVVLWAVSLLSYVACIAGQPAAQGSCTLAATFGTILPLAVVAFILGGIPWFVFIGLVRALRWWKARTANDPQDSQ